MNDPRWALGAWAYWLWPWRHGRANRGYYPGLMCQRWGRRPPAVWLPLKVPGRHAWVTPIARAWWALAFWRFLAAPFFRAVMWLGAWVVREGDMYTSGRVRWPWEPATWRTNTANPHTPEPQ